MKTNCNTIKLTEPAINRAKRLNQKKSSAFTALYTNLFAKTVQTIVPLFISILVIRLLSVKDFGTFSLFLSFLSIFAGLGFGIQHVYQRYVASYAEKKSDLRRLIKLTLVMSALRLGVFFAALSIVYMTSYLNIFDLNRLNLLHVHLLILTTVALICKFMLREGLLSAYLDHKFFNLFDNFIILSKALLILVLRPTTVIGFIYIWLFLETARVIVLTLRFSFIVYHHRSQNNKNQPSNLEYRRYLNYGKYFLAATLASQILAFDLDNYFLAYFRGHQEVALYSFATKASFFLAAFAPVNILFNITTPMLIKDYEQNKNTDRIRDIVSILFKLNIFVYATFAVFFALNIRFLVDRIFQNKYHDAIPYTLILLGISFLPVLKNTFEPVARGIERTGVYLFSLIGAFFNLVGNLILIPPFGISGAIISTGISLLIQSVAFVRFAHTEIKFSFDKGFLIKLFINMFPIVAIAFILQSRMQESLIKVLISNFFIVSIFLILFKINRCFNESETNFINSFLPRKIFIF